MTQEGTVNWSDGVGVTRIPESFQVIRKDPVNRLVLLESDGIRIVVSYHELTLRLQEEVTAKP